MPRLKRPELAALARRLNLEQLARAGGQVAESRRRRRWTQSELGRRVGLSQGSISLVEVGKGGGLSLDAWQRIGLALDRPLRVELSRDTREELADAGHLAVQEMVMRLGRKTGSQGTFELPTRPADPARSTDVGLRDDRHRRLTLVECWNTFGDLGAASRSTDRKRADAEGLAAVIGGDRPEPGTPAGQPGAPYTVHVVWVVRATRRNRELVQRYPEIFATRFPGSSRGWVRALTTGSAPPAEPGLVWCDVRATRLFAWRRRG